MANVTFSYKKTMTMYSVEIQVDKDRQFKIASGSSEATDLNIGTHSIRASIPFRGNEVSVISTQLDIKPNMKYEITYKPSAVSGAGTIEIKEIADSSYIFDDNGNRVESKNAVTITKIKGRSSSLMIVTYAFLSFIIIMLAVMFTMLFSFKNKDPLDINYINEPFTITEIGYDGSPRCRTSIESIEITSIEDSGIDELILNCEIIGVVEGDDYLHIEVKCYDEDDFLLGTESLISLVTNGERFKAQEPVWIPEKTARIEFVKD